MTITDPASGKEYKWRPGYKTIWTDMISPSSGKQVIGYEKEEDPRDNPK
jgi:hypothetical protein